MYKPEGGLSEKFIKAPLALTIGEDVYVGRTTDGDATERKLVPVPAPTPDLEKHLGFYNEDRSKRASMLANTLAAGATVTFNFGETPTAIS